MSGRGAALRGGRFNRKGKTTLYLALDAMTALMELTQGLSHRLLPMTMCDDDVDCEDIVDLRDADGRTLLHRFSHSSEMKFSEMTHSWVAAGARSAATTCRDAQRHETSPMIGTRLGKNSAKDQRPKVMGSGVAGELVMRRSGHLMKLQPDIFGRLHFGLKM